MVTDTEPGATSSATTTEAGDDCPDPTDSFVRLQLWCAQDFAVCDRRKVALEEMTARVLAVAGLQVTYEDALAEEDPALRQLLQDLKSIRTTVECLVPGDRQESLLDCFCERVKDENDAPTPQPMPEDPCAKAEQSQVDDLEELRRKQTTITRAIEQHKQALDELTGLPGTVKTKVGDLAAKVKDLNKRICDKSIDAERAFVTQLQYRREYVELRQLLTDPRTFVCRIYHLIDELFSLFEWDICVAGAIARLEKEEALEAALQKDEGAFIDDVLRCAKPEDPSKPSDDDWDEVEELDPCRCYDGGKPEPTYPSGTPEPPGSSGKPEPSPYGGGGGETPPTEQQHPPTEQHRPETGPATTS
jgi:hypothetical protein